MTAKSTHGGPGRGQGRKPLSASEPTVRVTVHLTQSTVDWLQRQGNLSKTVRKIIEETMNRQSHR